MISEPETYEKAIRECFERFGSIGQLRGNLLVEYREVFYEKVIEIKNKEIEELEKEIKRLKTVDFEPWKGKDKVEISQDGDTWTMLTHRKEKETGEVKPQKLTTTEGIISQVNALIKRRIGVKGETTSKEIAKDIIQENNFPISTAEFWGGQNRAKYYFPYLYVPLKVLEYKGIIEYGGRGKITRLR